MYLPTRLTPRRFRSIGLSLAELIIAASLLALVTLFMFNLLPSSLVSLRQSEHRLRANLQAQSILETDKAKGFPALYQETVSGVPTPSSSTFGDDGVEYMAVEQVRTELQAGFACPNLTTWTPRVPCPVPVTTVLVDVNEYWNEREDDPNPAKYLTWHTFTRELWISSVQP